MADYRIPFYQNNSHLVESWELLVFTNEAFYLYDGPPLSVTGEAVDVYTMYLSLDDPAYVLMRGLGYDGYIGNYSEFIPVPVPHDWAELIALPAPGLALGLYLGLLGLAFIAWRHRDQKKDQLK